MPTNFDSQLVAIVRQDDTTMRVHTALGQLPLNELKHR
jgi:hypothetical protein